MRWTTMGRRENCLLAYRHWRKCGYTRQGAFNLANAKWADVPIMRHICWTWVALRTNMRERDLV